MFDNIKFILGLVPKESKETILKYIKYIFTFYICSILFATLMGVVAGYIYGTELQQVRAYNTMIYSFQKIKQYDLRYKMPATEQINNTLVDTDIPDQLKPYFANQSEFNKLIEVVKSRTVNGVLIMDDVNLSTEAYNIRFNLTTQ